MNLIEDFTFKINKENFTIKKCWKHFKYSLYSSLHLTFIGILFWRLLHDFNFMIYDVLKTFFTLLMLSMLAIFPTYIIKIHKNELINGLLCLIIISIFIGGYIYVLN